MELDGKGSSFCCSEGTVLQFFLKLEYVYEREKLHTLHTQASANVVKVRAKISSDTAAKSEAAGGSGQ